MGKIIVFSKKYGLVPKVFGRGAKRVPFDKKL
jgi:hypothetical protein